MIGDGETEFTIYDGRNTEYQGTVADGRQRFEIADGIALINVATSDNGDFLFY